MLEGPIFLHEHDNMFDILEGLGSAGSTCERDPRDEVLGHHRLIDWGMKSSSVF